MVGNRTSSFSPETLQELISHLSVTVHASILYCFTVIIYYILIFSPSFSSSCFPSSLGVSPFTRGRKGLGTQTTSHQCLLSAIFLSIWRLFHWGTRGGGRTLFHHVGRISLIDGVPPDVYFMSPGRDSTGDAIRHDTGHIYQCHLITTSVQYNYQVEA